MADASWAQEKQKYCQELVKLVDTLRDRAELWDSISHFAFQIPQMPMTAEKRQWAQRMLWEQYEARVKSLVKMHFSEWPCVIGEF